MSNDIADTIVTLIIDKIISSACRNAYIEEINSNINSHCNKFINNILSSYLNNSFLFYENGLDKVEINQNEIFYNKSIPEKVNTWVSFTEPTPSKIDRYASNRNKYLEIVDNKINLLKKKSLLPQNPVMKEVNEYDKNKNININTKEKKEKIKIRLKDIWKKGNNNILLKNNNNNNKNNNLNLKTEQNNNKITKSPRIKEEILEIQGTFIPYKKNELINIILNDTEENNLLRKEREQQILDKEEMLKNENLMKQRARQNRIVLFNKKFDNDRLTFDPNGKVIRLHLPVIDSFNQDFIVSKAKIKNGENNNIRLSSISKDIYKTTKNIIKNNNKILKIIDEKLKLTSEKVKPPIINKENNNNSNNNNANNKEIIEYNPDDYTDDYLYNRYRKKKELIISGSNFDKMSPEVGVIISSDEKKNKSNEGDEKEEKINQKVGGFDYIKKYNRPSMNEINHLFSSQNLYMNSINSNSNDNNNDDLNNNKITSFFNYDYSKNNKNINNNDNILIKINNINKTSENDTINNENNYIGYKEEFNDNNNPLFKGAFQINDETKILKEHLQKKSASPSPLLPIRIKNIRSISNDNIFSTKRRIFKSETKDSIYQNQYNNFNLNSNNSNSNQYLSSNILLSQNFNSPNLKSIFMDENENYLSSDENKININKNNNIINDLKFNSINYENDDGNINVVSPFKILSRRKQKLPSITENNKKDKYLMEQQYMNKFNLGIVKNKNWGNENLDETNNNKNSYKNQFLRQRNRLLNSQNKIKSKTKEILKVKNKLNNKKFRYGLDSIDVNH